MYLVDNCDSWWKRLVQIDCNNLFPKEQMGYTLTFSWIVIWWHCKKICQRYIKENEKNDIKFMHTHARRKEFHFSLSFVNCHLIHPHMILFFEDLQHQTKFTDMVILQMRSLYFLNKILSIYFHVLIRSM